MVTNEGITGDWYMHVSINPTGFDCAMPITDFCMQIDEFCPPDHPNYPDCPQPACEASIVGLKGVVARNNPDETYMGPDGLMHTLTWTVPSVWGCKNLCAASKVRPYNNIGDVDGSRTWD